MESWISKRLLKMSARAELHFFIWHSVSLPSTLAMAGFVPITHIFSPVHYARVDWRWWWHFLLLSSSTKKQSDGLKQLVKYTLRRLPSAERSSTSNDVFESSLNQYWSSSKKIIRLYLRAKSNELVYKENSKATGSEHFFLWSRVTSPKTGAISDVIDRRFAYL